MPSLDMGRLYWTILSVLSTPSLLLSYLSTKPWQLGRAGTNTVYHGYCRLYWVSCRHMPTLPSWKSGPVCGRSHFGYEVQQVKVIIRNIQVCQCYKKTLQYQFTINMGYKDISTKAASCKCISTLKLCSKCSILNKNVPIYTIQQQTQKTNLHDNKVTLGNMCLYIFCETLYLTIPLCKPMRVATKMLVFKLTSVK